MTDPLDDRIAASKRKQASAREEAEAVIATIAATTSEYLVELAKYMMDRALRDKPDVIEKLEQGRLLALKASFNELLSQLPEITRARIEAIAWPHRSELPPELRSSVMAAFELGSKAHESIDQAARELIGRLGVLLVEAGFDDTSPHSRWKSTGKGSVAHAFGLPDMGFPGADGLKKAPDLYKPKLDAYVDASRALYDAEREKQQSLAKKRWDGA